MILFQSIHVVLSYMTEIYVEMYSVILIYFYYPLSLVGNKKMHHDHYKVLDEGSIGKFIMILSQFIMKDVYEGALSRICHI